MITALVIYSAEDQITILHTPHRERRVQVKYPLTFCNDGGKGGITLSIIGKGVIKLSLEFVIHLARFGYLHHPADTGLGDMHAVEDGINFVLCLDLTPRTDEGITILNHDVRLSFTDALRKIALNIKRAFQRQRVITQP